MPALLKQMASGDVFELGDFSIVGRGDAVTIRIPDGSISRQHATIRREERNYWLVDLGSANGSYVNDAALTAARVLRHGDRVQFGAVALEFHHDAVDHGDFSLNAKTQISLQRPQPLRSTPATLFVADLKDFSRLSNHITTGEVADLLGEWYADCNAVLKHYGASIDKFIGDCVFAYWHGTDHDIRMRALQAARALRAVEVAPVSPTRVLLRERENIALDCRIGLHIGPVAIGAMGTGINTALGDAVNMAFRIESLTRAVDTHTLVSAAFLDGWEAGRGHFASCGRHHVKGQPDAIEVFAPIEKR